MCYTNWQIGIITLILPGILMFPITYELSLCMLRKRVTSSTKFVAASACPYYALFLYMCKRKKMKQGQSNSSFTSPEEEEFAKRVLHAEEDLFSHQEQTLNWQTIQFYRTIVMNIASTFVTNPLYRLLLLAPVLCTFFVHDRIRQPFKDVHLNRIQAISSGCLLLVLLCNLLSSFSFMADISMVDSVTLVVKICNIMEMMLYVLVPLYLPVWKICDFIVLRREKKQHKGQL